MPPKEPTAADLAKKLRIKSTPDREERASKSVGKRTQMGVYTFLETLFELNEALDESQKMTDAEIMRQVITEYPDRPIAKQFRERVYTVNYYRNRYNNGTLFKDNKKPSKRSWRYDINGRRVDGRTGKHPL